MGPEIPGARVLDLFAGSGALGLEALSRGAAEAVFVDRGRQSLAAVEHNVARLGAGDLATVVRGEAIRYVRGLEPGAFDLALADPPYGEGYAANLVELFLERPFAHQLWVEHRRSESVSVPDRARQRRYGDTLLTTLFASP